MRLSKESIEEFRMLYEQEFQEPLSFDDATIRAGEIMALYEQLYAQREKERAMLRQEASP